MAIVRNVKLGRGKVHRQLEGPDQQEIHFTALVDGRPFNVLLLVPASCPLGDIGDELTTRVGKIAEMFAGTPVRLAYDTLATREPDLVTADRSTRRILGKQVMPSAQFFDVTDVP